MRRPLGEIAVLAVVMLVATAWLGWWTVPLVAAGWGFARPVEGLPVLTSAVSASVAWVVLLGVTALRGPVGTLADAVGGVMGVPGVLLVAGVLLFPAVLAGSAAAIAALVARSQR